MNQLSKIGVRHPGSFRVEKVFNEILLTWRRIHTDVGTVRNQTIAEDNAIKNQRALVACAARFCGWE
jgi:hypothetical protein